MKTKAKPLSRDQLKHLRSRIAEARKNMNIWGGDDEKLPPKIAAAKKLVETWDRKTAKAYEDRRKRIYKAEHAVEQTLLFDPDNALKAVQAFEKMKV